MNFDQIRRPIAVFFSLGFLFLLPCASYSQTFFDNDAQINTAYWSTILSGQYVADDFALSDTYRLRSISWKGLYGDSNLDDLFSIDFYTADLATESDPDPLHELSVDSLHRTLTGQQLDLGGTLYDIYEYRADIDPIYLDDGQTYWMSIVNRTFADWNWVADSTAGTTVYRDRNTNGWQAFTSKMDFQLAGDLVPNSGTISTNWKNATDGSWSTANRWDGNYRPNNGRPHRFDTYDVSIDATGQDYSVDFDSDITIDKLSVNSDDAVVNLNGHTFQVNDQLNLVAGRFNALGNIKNTVIYDPYRVLRAMGSGSYSSFWSNVTYNGDLEVDAFRLYIDPDTTVSGDWVINRYSEVAISSGNDVESNYEIASGKILLGGEHNPIVSGAKFYADKNITLILGEDVVVSGHGWIGTTVSKATGGTMINRGTVQVNQLSGSITLGFNRDTLIQSGDIFVGAINGGVSLGAQDNYNSGNIKIGSAGVHETYLGIRGILHNSGQIKLLNGASMSFSYGWNSLQQTDGLLFMEDASISKQSFQGFEDIVIHGGALKGTGAIHGNVKFGGELFIGLPTGKLHISSSDWNFTETAESIIDIGGLDKGVESDLLFVGGALHLDGRLFVNLLDGVEYTLTESDSIEIMEANSLTGEFDNVQNGQFLTTLDGQYRFVVNYGENSQYDPNSVVLSGFQAIPEPKSIAIIFLIGLVFITSGRRKSFQAAS